MSPKSSKWLSKSRSLGVKAILDIFYLYIIFKIMSFSGHTSESRAWSLFIFFNTKIFHALI